MCCDWKLVNCLNFRLDLEFCICGYLKVFWLGVLYRGKGGEN